MGDEEEEEEEERGGADARPAAPLLRSNDDGDKAAGHRPEMECPGCAYDRRKEELRLRNAKPYREFLYIWIISLTAGTS
jgi:hypothetical protein